jgi:plasmid stability protein
MKNVTITLDEDTATWARVYAAQHDISVSRMVGEMLRERMLESREYDEAMRAFLARGPVKLKRQDQRYPARDDLHDRARLR